MDRSGRCSPRPRSAPPWAGSSSSTAAAAPGRAQRLVEARHDFGGRLAACVAKTRAPPARRLRWPRPHAPVRPRPARACGGPDWATAQASPDTVSPGYGMQTAPISIAGTPRPPVGRPRPVAPGDARERIVPAALGRDRTPRRFGGSPQARCPCFPPRSSRRPARAPRRRFQAAVHRQDLDRARLVHARGTEDDLAPMRVLHEVRRRLGHDQPHAAAFLGIEPEALGQRRGPPARFPGLAHLVHGDRQMSGHRHLVIDPRALSGIGMDLEIAGEALRAAKPQPEPAGGREAVAQRLLHIRDARAPGLRTRPSPRGGCRRSAPRPAPRAAPSMRQRIPGQLAGRGDDLRLVHEAESGADRPLADELAHRRRPGTIGLRVPHPRTVIRILAPFSAPDQVHAALDIQRRAHARKRAPAPPA